MSEHEADGAVPIPWLDQAFHKECRKEIERLRAIVDHNDDLKYLCDLQAENGELRARIEELEENIKTVAEDPYYLRFLGNVLKEKVKASDE